MPHPRFRGPVLSRLPFAVIGGLLLLTLVCPLRTVAEHHPGPLLFASSAGPGSVLDRRVPDGPRVGTAGASHSAPSCHPAAAVPVLARSGQRTGPGPADRELPNGSAPVAAAAVPAAGRVVRGPDCGGSSGRCRLSVSCRWRI
ncbi:hypothetical protein [Streptomyces sp. NPDC057579]|uniref:hypothetical protein n=1 Tax=Streptomyces sp. NPDC057579 TaxID=3346172 RepID=UPI0036A6209A